MFTKKLCYVFHNELWGDFEQLFLFLNLFFLGEKCANANFPFTSCHTAALVFHFLEIEPFPLSAGTSWLLAFVAWFPFSLMLLAMVLAVLGKEGIVLVLCLQT